MGTSSRRPRRRVGSCPRRAASYAAVRPMPSRAAASSTVSVALVSAIARRPPPRWWRSGPAPPRVHGRGVGRVLIPWLRASGRRERDARAGGAARGDGGCEVAAAGEAGGEEAGVDGLGGGGDGDDCGDAGDLDDIPGVRQRIPSATRTILSGAGRARKVHQPGSGFVARAPHDHAPFAVSDERVGGVSGDDRLGPRRGRPRAAPAVAAFASVVG